MDIKLIAKPNDLYAEFYIRDVPIYLLNALRRTILTEVPTLAIHDVIIHMNTSVLYDEELALRLSLIPLTVDPSEIDILGKCRDIEKLDLSELSECTARLKLRKRNDTVDEIITIYAQDIEPVDKKSVRPVYNKIPIVKLGPGQEIDVEMIARVGKGKDHAKWIPVSTLGYKPLPVLSARENGNCTNCNECAEACPKGILEIKSGVPLLSGIALYLCDLDKVCVRACPKGILNLEPSESEYIFRIESTGQHNVEDIIKAAIDILNSKTCDFLKLLESKVKEFRRA